MNCHRAVVEGWLGWVRGEEEGGKILSFSAHISTTGKLDGTSVWRRKGVILKNKAV